MTKIVFLASAAFALIPTAALADQSSGHKEQVAGESQIPVCTHRIGTLAIVPSDNEWWKQYNLGSPEAVIKEFVQQSGCFSLVNRGSAMQSRSMERHDSAAISVSFLEHVCFKNRCVNEGEIAPVGVHHIV